jgi:hypothetical protein
MYRSTKWLFWPLPGHSWSAPLESGELSSPAGRDRWTDDGYRVGPPHLPAIGYLLLGGVIIFKQLTGLEYSPCPASLFNTAYMQGVGGEAPARTSCHARLPEEVMLFEPSFLPSWIPKKQWNSHWPGQHTWHKWCTSVIYDHLDFLFFKGACHFFKVDMIVFPYYIYFVSSSLSHLSSQDRKGQFVEGGHESLVLGPSCKVLLSTNRV